MKIGLVIMASGLSKRYGKNKLIEQLGNKPLIKWIIDKTDCLFDKRVVVTRNVDIKRLCELNGVDCVYHEFPGRNDTVRLGIEYMENHVDYCFFTPADQPLISKMTIVKLIESAKSCVENNNNSIIRTSYKGDCGSPVGFPKIYFDELSNLPEGKGGNYIVKNNPDNVVMIETLNDYELFDIDTPDDMEKMKNIVDKVINNIQ